MGAVNCRACKGARGRTIGYGNKSRWVDCNACNGSGINHDLWETHCRECYTSIIYPKSGNEPTYCKNCRNKEKTKDCEQWGCTNTIRYKLGWSEVPRYCRNCESKRNKGFTAKSCSGSTFFGSCGKLIWVPPDKNYTMCQECSERDRAEKAAKWKEKRCEGFDGASCSNNIKYNVDWDKVPNLCPSCIAKAKAKREADKAKWKEKPCAGGCGNSIKYNTDWDNPPNFCESCKKKRNERRHEPNYSENPRFNAACGRRGADLTPKQKDRFSAYFHQLPDRQRMSFDEIVRLANEWKDGDDGGDGFRRSDRR